MSIVKRKKQNKFFQMSNKSAQQDLDNLSSIGLLAYIISLPSDFQLHKTYLQNKFTRRTVDGAWKELVEKNYIVGFSCYINRKKQYFYLASDEQLTRDEFNEFVKETFKENPEAKNLQPIKDCNFSIVQNVHNSTEQNVQHSSDVQNVQYNEYSTPSTEPNEQIQTNNYKDIPQININKDISSVNTSEYINVIHSLFLELGEGLFSKDDIMYFADKILEEVKEEITHPRLYFSSVVEMIVMRRKKKLGLYQPPVEMYNWLEA